MHILYYCDEYAPLGTGGIGSAVKIVAEEMVRRGHDVSVVGYYPDGGVKDEEETINGVHVYRYDFGYRNSKSKHNFYMLLKRLGLNRFVIQKEINKLEAKINMIITKRHIDIIELPDFLMFNLQCSGLRYHRFSIPAVLRIHGSATYMIKSKGGDYRIMQSNDIAHSKRCDYLLAVSHDSKRYYKENVYSIPFIKEGVVFNPIEKSFMNKDAGHSSKTIFFFGKLKKEKGCYNLLKAFNVIGRDHPDWRLRLAGGGSIEEAKKYIATKVQGQVEFLGVLNREQIKTEIDNCAFACVPSYFETLGMVALEVMARSKAMIFTERTAGPEVITNGVDGILLNPEDVTQIVDSLQYLISNPNKCKEMGEAAYETINSKFSEIAIVDQLLEFYDEIVNS